MKSTGITRRVDDLGRVVLPKDMRTRYDIKVGDLLEIFVEGDMIIIKKYESSCAFCGEINNAVKYMDKNICENCVKELKKL